MNNEFFNSMLQNPIIMIVAGGLAVFMAFLLAVRRKDLPRTYQVLFGLVLVVSLLYFGLAVYSRGG